MGGRAGVAVLVMSASMWAGPLEALTNPDLDCLLASGKAAAICVKRYAKVVGACRDEADVACETAARSGGGTLDAVVAATEAPTREACTAESANKLTFQLGLDDLVFRTAQACEKWAEDFLAVAYADDLAGLSGEARACQGQVARQLGFLRNRLVRAYGRDCYAHEFAGDTCNRSRRDAAVAKALAAVRARIVKRCGATFDQLGLAQGATLEERVDTLLNQILTRTRHLVQRVYPPLNLGPTGLFGASPVGVRTFNLVDPSRLNDAGTGPRPLRVDVYYPSTSAAVAGVGRDPVPGFANPTYRDVARAPGTFPLVLFSPGRGSAPSTYVFLAAHLASHGIFVAGITHHADSSPATGANRPLDLRVLLDQLLAFNAEPGSFFENAIDPTRIGAAGHSLGGYAVMALASCGLDTFDARVKAIFPLEGSAQFFSTQAPGVFSTIAIPTLLGGGSSSTLAPLLQIAFDALPPGPTVTAYADLIDAFHGTFTDRCEIPLPAAECEPVALPWRYARHVNNYLALNFFDSTLNGNAEALARLAPAVVAGIDDVAYQTKEECPSGGSCSATCVLPCGDGIVGPVEACDSPGEQGVCAAGEVCNPNCAACVNCAEATVIGAAGGVFVGSTAGGTTALSSSCGDDVFAPERLFQWTPNVSHLATIQTCGGTTDYRTTLYVREGSCLGPELGCNRRGCGEHSRITLPVVAGTTYFIVVDGNIARVGNFTLSVQ